MTYIKSLLICLITVLALPFLLPRTYAFAEAEAVLSAPYDVNIGADFDVILTFSADQNIGWFETNFVYDSKLLKYVSGDANGGEGNLHLRCFPDTEQNTFSVTLKFSALNEGSAKLSLVNCSVFSPDGVPITNPTALASVNVHSQSDPSSGGNGDSSEDTSDTESSADNNTSKCRLKSLSLSAGEITPAFSPDIFDYTVKLKSGINKVEVLSELESVTDYIWFECSSWLSDTEDKKQIIVNIPDSEVKLKITVKDSENDPTVINVYRIMFIPETVTDSASESEADTSSVSSSESQSAVVTTVPENSTPDGTSVSSRSTAAVTERSGMAELRDKLMPWLLVVLLVLIIALILVAYWISSRTDRKRRKIKSSGSRK